MRKRRRGDGQSEREDRGIEAGHPPGPGSVWLKPERPKRGHAAPLSRGQIVRAALELIDAEGIDALSMRKLAARMGVGVMSLYWHVERKDDLLDLIGDAIFGEMDLPDAPTGDWRADLTLVAERTREIHLRHPWLMHAMGSLPHYGPNFLRHAEFSFGSLTRAGVAPETMISVVSAVDSFVFGSVMTWVRDGTADREPSPPAEQVVGQFQAMLARGDYPALQALMGHFADWVDDNEMSGQVFRFGLEALLDGAAARIAQAGTVPDSVAATRTDADSLSGGA